MGVPTVGTAVGVVAEMSPEAALAVPLRDSQALAEGILALLSDEPRRTRMAHAAQEFAQTHDADWTAAQFEALYRRLAGIDDRSGMELQAARESELTGAGRWLR